MVNVNAESIRQKPPTSASLEGAKKSDKSPPEWIPFQPAFTRIRPNNALFALDADRSEIMKEQMKRKEKNQGATEGHFEMLKSVWN